MVGVMKISSIKLSKQARDQLVRLKRTTGIKQWNILCRWALCMSLADPSIPPKADIPADSNVEMSWAVFGGDYRDLYLALLKERCHRDGIKITKNSLMKQLRLHLHRGIGFLFGDRRIASISDLISFAINS